MATQVGLTLVKRFTYRGDASEEFSNTYHFSGTVPADSTAWKALADALILKEKLLYSANAAVVRAYGYDSDADDAHAVWAWDYLAAGTTVAGTLTSSNAPTAGDQAVWIRWKTSRLNSKGKPIFLRKYFHCVFGAGLTSAGVDQVDPGWNTKALAFGAAMHDGTFLDARVITARGHSDTILNHGASTYITTRTLKRRGKRPGS